MARLIFIILFLPLFVKGAYTDSVFLINPVEVSGTVNVAGSVTVNNPVTSVSATVLNQITGFALESTQANNLTELQSINNKLTAPISVRDGAALKTLGTQLVASDTAKVTASVIHGLSSAGSGGYVDVKVNPSGALVADVTGSSVTITNPVSQITILNPSLSVTQGTSPWITSGTSFITNFPAFTGLTNAELRATPVPVSGNVTVNNLFSLESTQLLNNIELQAINQSTNDTEIAIENIDTKFNVVLDTRASESTLSAINNKVPTPTQRTPSYISTSAAGTVSAGAKSVSFHNAGFLNATVLGTTLSAGDVITFEAPDQDTLGAIAYVGTGTTLRILEVR